VTFAIGCQKEDVMTTPELRPLSLGELLDRTFGYYRQHFWLFMGIMALPQVLNVALALALQMVQPTPVSPTPSADPAMVLKQLGPTLVASFLFLIVFLVASLLIYAVALGATTHALSEVHLGRTASVSSAYQSLRGKIWRLFGLVFLFIFIAVGVYVLVSGATILLGGIVGIGLGIVMGRGPLLVFVLTGLVILLLLAGVTLGAVFLLRYAVAVPALVLEDIGIGQAMKRSASLTKGYRGQVFMIGTLMYVITLVVAVVFQAPFFVASVLLGFKLLMPLWLRIPYAITAGAGGALAGPFLMIALALAYYDTRVRKEGFDLQLMMAALDGTSPGGAPATAIPPVTS